MERVVDKYMGRISHNGLGVWTVKSGRKNTLTFDVVSRGDRYLELISAGMGDGEDIAGMAWHMQRISAWLEDNLDASLEEALLDDTAVMQGDMADSQGVSVEARRVHGGHELMLLEPDGFAVMVRLTCRGNLGDKVGVSISEGDKRTRCRPSSAQFAVIGLILEQIWRHCQRFLGTLRVGERKHVDGVVEWAVKRWPVDA